MPHRQLRKLNGLDQTFPNGATCGPRASRDDTVAIVVQTCLVAGLRVRSAFVVKRSREH